MGEGDTLVNALVGGAIMIFGGWIPFAPVLGGAVAGYLEGGERNDGVRVGVYAGLIGLLPMLTGAVLLTGLVGIGVGFLAWGNLAAGALGAAGLLVFLVFLALSVLYFVGLAAVGGWLGNYVLQDTDVDL